MYKLSATAIIIFCLTLSISLPLHSDEYGHLGLYTDMAHSSSCLETFTPNEFRDIYIWCQAPDDGMNAVEFAVSNNDGQGVIFSFTPAPGVSVTMGDLPRGITLVYAGCQNDWTFVGTAILMPASSNPAIFSFVPNGDTGNLAIRTCAEGNLLEPISSSPLYLIDCDQSPPYTLEVLSAEAAYVDAIYLTFNGTLNPITSQTSNNYEVFESSDQLNSFQILSAELQPDFTTVKLALDGNLVSGIEYTVRISNVTDNSGWPISTGFEVTCFLTGPVPPVLVSLSVVDNDDLELVFSEPVTHATAEEINNYELFETAVQTNLITITSVDLQSDDTTLILSHAGMTHNTVYTLRVNDISDRVGHIIEPDSEIEVSFYDTRSPLITGANAESDILVGLSFDEPLDATTAEVTSNYLLHIAGSNPVVTVPILSATLIAPGDSVSLSLGGRLSPVVAHVLNVDNVTDPAGNIIAAGTNTVIPASSTPPTPYGRIGIYTDMTHSISCMETVNPFVCQDVYIWCQAPVYGMNAVEFAAHEYFGVGVILSFTPTPDVSVTVGDIFTGIAMTYAECQNDWVFAGTLTILGLGYYPTSYNIIPNGDTGNLAIRTCAEGNPLEPISPSSLYVLDCDEAPPYTLEFLSVEAAEFDAIYLTFNRALDLMTSQVAVNYQVFESADQLNSFQVISAELQPDLVTVKLTLDHNMVSGIEYTVRISNVTDNSGELLSPGSEVVYYFDANVSTMLVSYQVTLEVNAIHVQWELSKDIEASDLIIEKYQSASDNILLLNCKEVEKNDLGYSYIDKSIEPGSTYSYSVSYRKDGNTITIFKSEDIHVPELPLTLHQNYPNPFNPTTTISFYLPKDDYLYLAIYDTAGKRVVVLSDAHLARGTHTFNWDGKNGVGNLLASGIYFYKIKTSSEQRSKKMVLLR